MIGDFRLDDPDSDERQTTVPAPAAASAGAGAPPAHDHATRVIAHEATTGWSPERAVRLASVTSQIAKLQRQTPVSTFTAVIGFVVGLADIAVAGAAILWALTGRGDQAEAGVLILLAMFVPTVWAAWVLSRLAQRRRVHALRDEREDLRRARGCGDPDCAQCELSGAPRRSGG